MVQIFPRSDDFTENSASPATSAVGAFFSGYIRSVPRTGAAFTTTVSSNTYTFLCVPGNMVNGYTLEGGLPFNTANFVWTAPGATEFVASSRYHFFSAVWRKYWAENCTAKAAFFNHAIQGGLNPKSFKNAGVAVRVQGGTASGTGQSEIIGDHTAYWFVCVGTATAGVDPCFFLLRCNAGTWTELASERMDVSFPGQGGGFWNSAKAYTMSLTALTSGSTVVLTAKVGNAVDPVSGEEIGAETTIFGGNVVDSSGSRITGAGRCGWGMSGYDDQGNNPPSGFATSRSTHLCSFFQITDTTSGEVEFRDEFERLSGYGTGSNSASTTAWRDPNGIRGRQIAGIWSQDAYGAGGTLTGTGSGNLQNLRVDTGNNRLSTPSAGAVTLNAAFSLVPSFSTTYSDRECTFNCAALINDSLGLRGRANALFGSGAVEHGGGYNFLVSSMLAATPLCRIQSVSASGAATLIAQYTGTNAEFSISAGNPIKLRLKIDNIGQDLNTAQVRVQAWINDVQVPFDSQNPVGVTFDGDAVIDNRSSRTVQGWLEGITFEDWQSLRIDSWNDLSSATPPDPDEETIPEEDMPSVAFNSECTGKTGTFTTPYDWGCEEIETSRANVHEYESGHVQRFLVHLKNRRRWRISANAITDSERTTLLDFWTAHKGAEIPFDWAEPELGATVAVRFASDELGVVLANPAVHQFAFELEEVFC